MDEETPQHLDLQQSISTTKELGFLDDGFKIKRKSKNDLSETAMITESLADHASMRDDPSAVYLKAPDMNVTQVFKYDILEPRFDSRAVVSRPRLLPEADLDHGQS